MSCANNWTIEFLGVDDGTNFEIRPIEMSLKMSRHQYDFCRAKFSTDVGDMMKPHTRAKNGKLRKFIKVNAKHNGNVIRKFLFRPDWVDFGDDYTHIEFHDLHKSLASGTVDIQEESVVLKDIYKRVINQANNRLISEVKVPGKGFPGRVLYGQKAFKDTNEVPIGAVRERTEERKRVSRELSSKYAVDFQNISPEKAIRALNKKYRLKSWVNTEGKLIIGVPEAQAVKHIAAPDDDRVWRYKDDFALSHSREPIKKVLVQGNWIDEPGWGGFDELVSEVGSWFGGKKKGSADVRAYGMAINKNANYGSDFIVKNSRAKKDALPSTAKAAMIERMKQTSAGTVPIDPVKSGERVSKIIDLRPGDYLHLVPDDNFFKNPDADSGEIGERPDIENACEGFVSNEEYLVIEVEHNLTDSGHWEVNADVTLVPDINIETKMAYFDPEAQKFLTKDNSEDVNDDGLSFSLLEDI